MKNTMRLVAGLCLLAAWGVGTASAQYQYPFQNPDLPAEQPLAPETVDVGAKRIDGHRRIALPSCSPFNLVRGVAAQSGGMGTALFTAHHQHRACRMVEDRVAVRPDQTGQFVGVDTTGDQ